MEVEPLLKKDKKGPLEGGGDWGVAGPGGEGGTTPRLLVLGRDTWPSVALGDTNKMWMRCHKMKPLLMVCTVLACLLAGYGAYHLGASFIRDQPSTGAPSVGPAPELVPGKSRDPSAESRGPPAQSRDPDPPARESDQEPVAQEEAAVSEAEEAIGLGRKTKRRPSDIKCQGPGNKGSFPDLDYALLGYNMFRGYPLATGHDPGFTQPIFTANYSENQQTADCRHSVPSGLLVIPDVSCEISFNSQIARTRYELQQSVAVSFSAHANFFNVFTAKTSAEYQYMESQMATGECIYIMSTAGCDYYYSSLLANHPPELNPYFLEWVRRLSRTNNKRLYLKFFEIYGTHFPKQVTFGARFTYEYKMSMAAYERMVAQSVDVKAEASLNAWYITAGASAAFSYKRKQRQSAFMKAVQVRKVTTGSVPPPKGNAGAWASTVSQNPVPIKYELEPMENLFSRVYMARLGVDLKKIRGNIRRYRHDYCKQLKHRGELSDCTPVRPGIEMRKTRLYRHYRHLSASLSECVQHCLDDLRCVAITTCLGCKKNKHYHNVCYMYRQTDRVQASWSSKWVAYVFYEKISKGFVLHRAQIRGVRRELDRPWQRRAGWSSCRRFCLNDPMCVAFTYVSSSTVAEKCRLFGAEYVEGMTYNYRASTTFAPWRKRQEAIEEAKNQTDVDTGNQGEEEAGIQNEGETGNQTDVDAGNQGEEEAGIQNEEETGNQGVDEIGKQIDGEAMKQSDETGKAAGQQSKGKAGSLGEDEWPVETAGDQSEEEDETQSEEETWNQFHGEAENVSDYEAEQQDDEGTEALAVETAGNQREEERGRPPDEAVVEMQNDE